MLRYFSLVRTSQILKIRARCALARGRFNVSREHLQASGFPGDTYLDTSGWGRGVAFVNGFHLGWYWPAAGPQLTLYVPGPVLRPGSNELVLLEMGRPAEQLAGMGALSWV